MALVPLPTGPVICARKAETQARVKVEEGGFVLRFAPKKPPRRVESTQPRDTSPEPPSSREETAGERRITGRCLRIMLLLVGNMAAVMPMGKQADDG